MPKLGAVRQEIQINDSNKIMKNYKLLAVYLHKYVTTY